MNEPARQLVLDLPHREARGLEDFIVSGSNEAAVRLVDSWPQWPHFAVAIAGPAGSGKSHLASVWQQQADAVIVPAAGLDEAAGGRLASLTAIVIEDADRGIGSERTLFHLMNLGREQDLRLLMTGRSPPGDWPVALPDLRSRLRACPVVLLGEPDENLLLAVLVKLLHDRQLPATPAAVTYLARHLDRSMASVLAVVEALDRLLWDKPSEITREVARKALDAIGQSAADE